MRTLDFYNGDSTETVVALGFFDSIHVGHQAIINKAKHVAENLNVGCAVFTFKNDIDSLIKDTNGLVFTYEERLKKLSKLSVDSVISTIFTKEFSSLLATEFFNALTSNFKVKAIVCGKDYRFGYKGEGDVDFLQTICKDKGVLLYIVEDFAINEKRVSTTYIKELLLNGQIKAANELLGGSYFLSGEVEHGREVGRGMGFPTANVTIDKDKAKIKSGVYKTHVAIEGKTYNCITNYGSRPTFDLNEVLTETYIDGYKGDLYGKNLTIFFDEYLRECFKFNSIDELTAQLQKDLEKIR